MKEERRDRKGAKQSKERTRFERRRARISNSVFRRVGPHPHPVLLLLASSLATEKSAATGVPSCLVSGECITQAALSRSMALPPRTTIHDLADETLSHIFECAFFWRHPLQNLQTPWDRNTVLAASRFAAVGPTQLSASSSPMSISADSLAVRGAIKVGWLSRSRPSGSGSHARRGSDTGCGR